MQERKKFTLGYSLVVHSIIMYLISTWIAGLSANFLISAISEKLSQPPPLLYSINTYGALAAVLAAFLFNQLSLKFGPRIITVITLFVCGVAAAVAGFTTSLAVYTVMTVIQFCCAQGFGYGITNTLMANWFPKKKSVVYGITTTGCFFVNWTIIPVYAAILGRSNVGNANLFVGIVCVAFAIASIFWVKNRPQDVGLYPDNDPESAALAPAQTGVKSEWTIGRLLRTPIVWFFAIAFGFLLMMSSGVPSQIIPMLLSRGVDMRVATLMMSVTGITGVLGSVATGFIDKRIGARNTTLIMGVTFVVSLGIMALSTNVTLTLIMLSVWGFFCGGCFNMCPSLVITMFGAKDYNAVNRIIHPLTQAIKACSFVTIGLTSALGSGFSGTLWAFTICIVITMIFVLPIKKGGRLDPCKMPAETK